MTDVSAVQMLVSARRDLQWYEANREKLISKYNNKFIAFHDNAVIETDTNLESLMNRLKKRGIDTSTVFIEFISKVKSIL